MVLCTPEETCDAVRCINIHGFEKWFIFATITLSLEDRLLYALAAQSSILAEQRIAPLLKTVDLYHVADVEDVFIPFIQSLFTGDTLVVSPRCMSKVPDGLALLIGINPERKVSEEEVLARFSDYVTTNELLHSGNLSMNIALRRALESEEDEMVYIEALLRVVNMLY